MAYVISTIHPALVLRTGSCVSDEIAADLGKAWRISNEGPQLEEHILWVLPGNPLGIEECYRRCLAWLQHWRRIGASVAVDVETSALDYYSCKLYSIAIAEAQSSTAVSFTLQDFHTMPATFEAGLVAELRALLADEKVEKVFHNAPFDMSVLHRKGLGVRGPILDTQGLHHLVQPATKHDLQWVAASYLDVEPWKLDHESGKMANTKNPVELLIYNAKDALYTAKLVEPLMRSITARGMSPELARWQAAFAQLAVDMELAGIPVNLEKRRAMAEGLRTKMRESLFKMREFLSWPDFSPMSNAHRKEALFGSKYAQPPWNLGLTPGRKTKKLGEPSTSYKSVIDYYEHPFVRALATYVESRQTYAIQYKDGTLSNIEGTAKEGPGAYQQAIGDDLRLHCRWKSNTLASPRFGSEPNCLSADTELLTEWGWLPFPVAKKGHARPLQYDPSTEQVSIAPNPQYLTTRSRDWVHLKTEAIDHLSTAMHRMLIESTVRRACQKVRVLRAIPASELLTRPLSDSAVLSCGADSSIVRLGFKQKDATGYHYDKPRPAYCVTVPTGYIFVRRNGHKLITGNCQNQRSEDRRFFEAGPGRVFVGADKSQLELRIVACHAGVRELIEEMAKPDGDPHRLAALHVYGPAFLEKDAKTQKALRNMVKNVVYASLYMAGPETVWRTIRERKQLAPSIRAAMTLPAVKFIHSSYFMRYQEIPRYNESLIREATQNGYIITSRLGRRRYFPVKPVPATEVVNARTQSWGADDVTREMVLIQDELRKRFHGRAYMFMHCHDEAVAECDERDAEEVKSIFTRVFGATPLDGPAGRVYLTAEAQIGKDLYQVKYGTK